MPEIVNYAVNGAQKEFVQLEINGEIYALGGRRQPVVQPLNVTRNGNFAPPTGVDGYAPVSVKIPSDQKPEQIKTVTITKNGDVNIMPDAGKVLTSVLAKVKVENDAAQQKLDSLISRGISTVRSYAGKVGKDAFSHCDNLTKVDLPNATLIEAGAFTYASKLQILILRANSVCVLRDVYAFQGSNIWGGGTGAVYVPRDLVETYKASTNWSSLPSYLFKAIEDYPEITGG